MKKLLSFYGDDFTGSTDVMEALATHGVETVLFTRIPTPQELAPFANCLAIGVAGTSRSQKPEWMDEHLPRYFLWLKALDAQFCHYKVCSTFDSSPTIGNIGRAAEIGVRIFAQNTVPLVVGAPQLKRFTFAAHLFAGYQGETFRIDRHPVMSRHPVTPMRESDLRLHIAQQTHLQTSLFNAEWPEDGLVLIDVHNAETQLRAGEALLEAPAQALPFIVGSSGVEYALMKALSHHKLIAGHADFAPLEKVRQCIVISGSVSPTTERQIRYATQRGFTAVDVSPLALAQNSAPEIQMAIERCLIILSQGQSPLVHTALGPGSDVGVSFGEIPNARQRIGEGLGLILKSLLERTQLKRAIIAGGDSSSHALGQLDVYALQTRYPLTSTPGSPLCTATSNNPHFDGLEIAMKGGQVGSEAYFVQLRDGLQE